MPLGDNTNKGQNINLNKLNESCIFVLKKADMESIIITPKNKAEFKLFTDLFEKMNAKIKVLSDEQKEDMGLAMLMKEADRKVKVSKETILKKLKS